MIKITTWNVNSIKARLDHALRWLQENQPDFLCLQELKGQTDDFPLAAFHDAGYAGFVHGQKAYNGVAILYRNTLAPTLVTTALQGALSPGGSSPDDQARYIEIKTDDFHIINIYAPNGNPLGTEKFPYKLQWLDCLIARARHYVQNQTPFMIVGDFNIIPENGDCHNPAAWQSDALFQLETRQRYRILYNMGLTDAFRALHPEPGHYTFWDYQAGALQRNDGIRIDHIFLSPALADRLQACHIDKTPRTWERPSDHVPITVTLV